MNHYSRAKQELSQDSIARLFCTLSRYEHLCRRVELCKITEPLHIGHIDLDIF